MVRRCAAGSSPQRPHQGETGRLAYHHGYTITTLVEELVERVERQVTARLPSRALKAYYDAE
jgi:hypothetical protein